MSPAPRDSVPLPERFYKAGLVLAVVALLGGVNFSQRHLNRMRDSLGLTRVTPLENAPPMLAFTTVALGGFRGLIANILWLRVSEMQEQDKFFEMVQLSDWITKLQPHIATVWQHLAWNMSYNISVKFGDARDRWKWVQRGIHLLRDEAIPLNPHTTLLYYELAWHFQHKMGHYLDDAHNYYKSAWAVEMNAVLGPGKPNFDELIKPTSPEAQERATKLRDVYKMDPALMKQVDETYGPLEWRLPETHAIYWAIRGLEMCPESEKDKDRVQVRRIVHQALQLAFQRGRLVYPPSGGERFQYRPNIEIVDKVNKAFLEMIEQEENGVFQYAVGHKNFLRQAVYSLYIGNRIEAATQWLKYLDEKYPGAVPPEQSLHDFAMSEYWEIISDNSPDKFGMVLSFLFQREFVDLAMGLDASAAQYEGFARKIGQEYLQRVGAGTILVPGPTSSNAFVRVNINYTNLWQDTLKEVLNPQSGILDPGSLLVLRTKLHLPANWPEESGTNQVPIAPPALQPNATNTPTSGRPGTTNSPPPPKPSG